MGSNLKVVQEIHFSCVRVINYVCPELSVFAALGIKASTSQHGASVTQMRHYVRCRPTVIATVG